MENGNRTVPVEDMPGVDFDNIFASSPMFGWQNTEIQVTAQDLPYNMREVPVTDTAPLYRIQ